MQPKTIAKLVGLGAGTLVGGPLLAALGASCGGFIGEMLGDEDESGWGLGEGLKELFGDICESRVEQYFEETGSEFNHDLRRAAAHALANALAWKRKPGPLAAAMLETDDFKGMSSARREMLKRLFSRWQDHIQEAVNVAEERQAPALLSKLLPPGDDDMLTTFADAKRSRDLSTIKAWVQFYERTLQPVLDTIVNKDDLKQLNLNDLRKGTIEGLAKVFPAAFIKVVKQDDYKKAWIAYQKALLTAIQRVMNDIGVRTRRLPEIEAKMDALVNETVARGELERRLAFFLSTVETNVDGSYVENKSMRRLITESRESIQAKLRLIQKKMTRLEQSVAQVGNDMQRLTPLRRYKDALFDAYAAYVEVGNPIPDRRMYPRVETPSINDIFVAPFCSTERVSPARMEAAAEAALRNGNAAPGEALLVKIQAIFTKPENRRVVLLGDPGMGKSTLVRWLTVAPLPKGKSHKPLNLPQCLKSAIPLPFIVRELVPHLPEDPEAWDWEALTDAFRKFHATSTAMGPLLEAYDGKSMDSYYDALLEDKNALFLIDGLDEIGTLRKRVKMSAAIMEGFKELPYARFIITSRIVGYDDARVHERAVEVVKLVHPQKGWVVTNLDEAKGYESDWERIELAPGESFLREPVAQVVYLTPFMDQQQDQYCQRWFVVRFGEATGKNLAVALMNDVRKKRSISTISRVPNLLCLMALLRSQNVPLPDGRAKLYRAISEAYLHTIQEARGINPEDYGHSLPYSRKRAEEWLAIIAMHLQRRLGGREDEVKMASNRRQRREEEGEKVLATQADLFEWLLPFIAFEMPEHPPEELIHQFLHFITQRTAFLLQRGEGQYGFAHLSFLEYYAARWLEIEFRRLVNGRTAKDWISRHGLEHTKKLFEQRSGEELWHEPLHFLSEILSENEHDVQTILEWLFPWFKEEDMQVMPEGERPSTEAGRLLATLSLDIEIAMPLEQRRRCWTYVWKQWLANQPKEVVDLHPWHVAPYLLEASQFQEKVVRCLAPLLRSHRGLLRLSACPALDSLAFLSDATEIDGLSLSYCASITSSELGVFAHLRQLTRLRVHQCPRLDDLNGVGHLKKLTNLMVTNCPGINDLSALQGMDALQRLNLRGCTGVSDLGVLGRLSGLLILDLIGCTGVSDLSALKSLSNLEALFLEGCTGIGDLTQQVEDLRRALPNLMIHW